MVRITDGRVLLVVPTSAFRDVYSRNGFHICEDVAAVVETSVVDAVDKYSNVTTITEASTKPEKKDDDDALNNSADAEEESAAEPDDVDTEHAEDEGTTSEDDKFLDNLFLKSIETWSKKEVKRAANIKGINLAGTNNIQEARELLKSELLS